MKALFIGGTGLISSACAERAFADGWELTVLNRGRSRKYPAPAGAEAIPGDVHGDLETLRSLLDGREFDTVVDWIAYTPADVERDIALFRGRTRQFIFISSASAYRKPPADYRITESTPLENPFWEYSRNKIACEDRLLREFRERQFPATIVRPSLTYGPSQIPLCVNSWEHPYTAIDRIRRGKPVIVPGDGTSLWVMTWNADFAVGFCGLMGMGKAVGEIFHITSDEALPWNQIYLEAGRAAGAEPKLVHVPSDLIAAYDPDAVGSLLGDKSHSLVFDNAKIKSFVPDFAPKVRWAEGVRRALDWFDADPRRCTIDGEASAKWDKILSEYEKTFPGR
ncbi:MAG: SDR family oxidoreductase [Anaerolineales bacterium]|nr:SDR family oxidoreductase [Anaerolineales bacterium]